MMGAPEPVRPPLRIKVAGAWPFITFRSYHLGDRPIVWRARQHRKGLARHERALEISGVPFWQTRGYNWWNALAFAIGSCLFILGSLLSLLPAALAPSVNLINAAFFAGSIPFTIGGFMQNFQAANATEFSPDPATPQLRHVALIGWHPKSPGWLSTFTQFIGTIQFNFNTFDPFITGPLWYMQDAAVWVPGMVGSVLFLVSGYLAYIEAGHGYWSWRPKDLDWQIVAVNLLGCIFFMTASTLAWVPESPNEPGWIMDVSNIHLALGGLCFLIGGLLTMRESRQAEPG
ncbi:hypothetical protein ACRC7T_12650 [Segnochrobactraceae bacterium EtOH-i3]